MKKILHSKAVIIILFITVLSLSSYIVLDDDSKYGVIIFPKSNYVMLGEKYTAQIFLTKNLPKSSSANFSGSDAKKTVVKKDSYFEYSIKPETEGFYEVEGSLDYTENGEKKSLPFSTSYVVAKPASVVSSNCLIKGIENKINPSMAGVPPNDLIIESDNGIISKKGFEYYITPEKAGKCFISLKIKTKEGTKKIDTFLFDVFEKK